MQSESLDRAIVAALDELLQALALEPLGADRFRAPHQTSLLADRIFGGQLVAQALLAASRTVTGKAPNSLHAYFVEAGTPDAPLELAVDAVRDGRSIATRRVTITQRERLVLIAMVSFHTGPTSPRLAEPAPAAPAPEDWPVLQRWVGDAPASARGRNADWTLRPPPVAMRIAEPPTFMGGPSTARPRSHWMRLPRGVGEDPLLHTALLAYASDFLLMDMVLRSHPDRIAENGFTGFSLDHAIWFHGPVRFDRWHLHTQETQALSGHLGLVRGRIHDADGQLVASVIQDNLIRAR